MYVWQNSPKLIYRCNTITIKIAANFLIEFNKLTPNSYGISGQPALAKIILKIPKIEDAYFPISEVMAKFE